MDECHVRVLSGGARVTSRSTRNGKLPNIRGGNAAKPKHSIGYISRHRVLGVFVAALVAVVAFSGTFAAASYLDIDTTIRNNAVKVISSDGSSTSPTTIDQYAGKTLNILILGQDTRSGSENAAIGGGDTSDASNHQSDTAMVMQISADRSYINLVSIPRDSLVDAPSCQTTKGTVAARYNVMFNSIFATGYATGGDIASAASCTMTAVNALTGLDISNFIVVDFSGLKSMIDAIGGVDVCIPQDTEDSYTNLKLSKGYQHLTGTQATQYARMRHGTGTDGSDIMRTTRQQYLIKALLNKAVSKNLLTNSSELYQLAKAAISSLQLSEGLASTTGLAGLAMSLANIDSSHIYAQTIPVEAAPSDKNRVVWSSSASEVWAKFQKAQPLTQSTQSTSSASASSSSSSAASSTASSSSASTQSSSSSAASASTSTSSSASASSSVNATTGLITNSSGQLIDPATGGIVDPETGTIRDANTGQYIGIADRYLQYTVCGVPAQE
ncbi:LCP family protein [Bifidobacterium psychraerophilum]|jgi:LCP family protein required for cell wall assembly|uniref:LCP family protein n=1 Tax=Bifidobacterium psychraerophilum TaxID=218140 RepID=UPI0039EAF0E9